MTTDERQQINKRIAELCGWTDIQPVGKLRTLPLWSDLP